MRRALLPPLTPQELWVLCGQMGLPLWCGAAAGVLHRLRRRRGWSQAHLARASGVSRQIIGEIEQMQTLPTMDKIYRLVRALRLDITRFDTLVTIWMCANAMPL